AVSPPSGTTMARSSRIAPDGNRVEHDDIGWTRKGRKGAFRYYDGRGRRIGDEAKLARIEALAIPPAWEDVSISPRATAKLQATGLDAAGRKQYLYSANYRAQQERAKYDKLIRFGDALPALREAMALHFDQEEFDRERVSAIAVVEQYLDGRTIDDFRPRHLRVVKARAAALSPEEQAVLSLLRSWRIRRAREAA